MREVVIQRLDNTKKGRVILISLLIVLSLLGDRLFGFFGGIWGNPINLSILYSLFAVLAFFWVLQFKLNLRIVFLTSFHLALIIFSQILFYQTFLADFFDRVYETLLLIIILIITFLVSYSAFLTANIFAVSSFKKIPLEAVAKTSIYFITVLSIFFLTYGFLSLGMPIWMVILVLLIFYIVYTLLLMSNFFFETRAILSNSLLIFWNLLLILIGIILFSTGIEFVAFIMAVVFYYVVDLFIEKRQEIAYSRLIEYFFLIILLVLIIFSYSY